MFVVKGPVQLKWKGVLCLDREGEWIFFKVIKEKLFLTANNIGMQILYKNLKQK